MNSTPSHNSWRRIIGGPAWLIWWLVSVGLAIAPDVNAQHRPTAHQEPRASIDASVGTAEMADNVALAVGKSLVVKLPMPVSRVSVGNPIVADVILLSPQELYLVAKAIGNTNVVLWPHTGSTRTIDVEVGMDSGALQSRLVGLMPAEKDIRVQMAGDSLVLTGTVSSPLQLDKALELAEAFSGKKVLNFMQLGAPQQVMLEVKVAEINRTLSEQLGFDFTGALTSAGGAWTRTVSGILGGGNATLGANYNATQKISPFSDGLVPAVSVLQPTNTNMATQDLASFLVMAQKTDGLVKILAEPTIVAISGQEGSFLAGGEIMIPVPQSGGTTIMQAKQFGVELRFTPTVLENGTIHIKVTSVVSSLVGFSQVANTALGGAVLVPTLTTRNVSTTVQLHEGQSLAIGGLLQDGYRNNIKRFPILGDIPILGFLFRSSDYQKNKTELLIVVTPHLAQSLTKPPRLPTDGYVEPTRSQFLFGGMIEGTPPESDSKPDPKMKAPPPPAQ